MGKGCVNGMKLPEIAILPTPQSEKITGDKVAPMTAPLGMPHSAGQKNEGHIPSKTELEQAAKKVNDTLSAFNIQERFVIGGKSGEVVVYLINTAKHEIVCRIPPDKVFNAARQLQEYIGMFLNEWI